MKACFLSNRDVVGAEIGSWFVVRSSWFRVLGSWCVVRSSWFVVPSPYPLLPTPYSLILSWQIAVKLHNYELRTTNSEPQKTN